MKTALAVCAGVALLVAVLEASMAVATATPPQDMGAVSRPAPATVGAARFDAAGMLQRPKGYRRWMYVGTPLTPDDMNDGAAAFPEFHSVYVDPAGFDAYQRTGRWADGTVVLKELVSVGGKASTSGKGYFMGEFLGLEAMVRDAERFPDAPGHWGFFRFTDEQGGAPHHSAEVLPTASCAACHSASADDDLVFTQHYPVLRAAKGFGPGSPEDA